MFVIQTKFGFFFDKKDLSIRNGLYYPNNTSHINFANIYKDKLYWKIKKDIWICNLLQWDPRVIDYEPTPNYL